MRTIAAAVGIAVALLGAAPVPASAATPEDTVTSLQRLPGGGLVKPVAGTYRGFRLEAVDEAGAGVAGVALTARFVDGPNGPSAETAGSPVTCSTTHDDGSASCGFTPQRAGTDRIRVHVDQGGGRSGDHDPGEPFLDTSFITEAAPNTTPTDARVISMDPETTTFSSRADTARSYVATVRDRSGLAVQGATVEFTEEGPGALDGGAASVTRTTDELGQASVIAGSQGEVGTQVITGRIATPGSECDRAADDPSGAPAGACTDTSTVTYSPDSGPHSPPQDCRAGAQVLLDPDTITATGAATVTVREAPHTLVDLFAYTRPSTEYQLVRSAMTDSSGVATFTVRPPANTRLKAAQRDEDCTDPVFGTAPSVVLNVRTALTLTATRNGPRDYTFGGDSLPARPGGLVVSLYRVTEDGRQILTAQARASATSGEWVIDRRFTGSGRFGFVVLTGQDLQNAPGVSNTRSTLIH
jgi:hypothetical protein